MSALQATPAIGRDPLVAELRISILHVPDCPLVGKLRARVESALADTASSGLIEEIEGPYLSPTVLINGVALAGFPLRSHAACRIDLPTQQEIASAILGSSGKVPSPEEGRQNED